MRIMLKHTLNISNRHAAQELEENTRRVTSNITQSINALLNISLHTGGAGGGGAASFRPSSGISGKNNQYVIENL